MARAAFSKTSLARVVEDSDQPFYVLDRKRRITYANGALARFLHTDLASLHGMRCDYSSAPPSPGGGICPPPAVWEGKVRTGRIFSSSPSPPEPRSAIFVPLLDTSQQVLAVFCLAAQMDDSSSQELSADFESLWHQQLAGWRHGGDPWKIPPLCVGKSAHAARLREQLHLASASAVRIVVLGTEGSEREQLARQIHARRNISAAPRLVPLVCPLLDAELLQSTVVALLQECAELETELPPTLCLLDVDQLPSAAQEELRDYLAIEEFSLRTMATARHALPELARQDAFDPELALLLSTLELPLPPLNARPEDVPWIAQALVEEWNEQSDLQRTGFSDEALDWLTAYPWPGDLAELRGVVRNCCQRATQSTLGAALLPATIRLGVDALSHPPRSRTMLPLDQLLEQTERDAIEDALREKRHNRAAAARLLGISRGRLLRRIAQLGIGEDHQPS